MPTNYVIIRDSANFTVDFAYSILSLFIVGLALFLFWAFSRFRHLRAYFYQASCTIIFSTIIVVSLLLLSVSSVVLQNQAMLLLAFLYILGFVLSGIKPLHMLWLGAVAASIVLFLLYIFDIPCDFLIVGRM